VTKKLTNDDEKNKQTHPYPPSYRAGIMENLKHST